MPSRAELDHVLDGLIVEGGPLSVHSGTLRRHQDTYFDTEDEALASRGWALRRRSTSTSVTICLKDDPAADASVRRGGSRLPAGAALFERFELEVPHAGPTPPWPREIEDVLDNEVPAGTLATARPRVVLDVVRISHRLAHAGSVGHVTPVGTVGSVGGGLSIELSFDEVTCSLPRAEPPPDSAGETAAAATGGATVARFHEVELEAGPDTDVRALQVVADALSEILPLTASSVSKAERARALLAPFMVV